MTLALVLLATLPAFATGPPLVHPADNATVYVSLPYFDWVDFVSSPFPGSYEIQIDDSSSFSPPLISATVPAFISFYSPNAELALGTYYWRVRHLPVSGPPSGWSEPEWHFTLSAIDTDSDNFFGIPPNPTWTDIKNELRRASLYAADHPSDFVEVRFPEGEGPILLT